jgi:hypothetical protein
MSGVTLATRIRASMKFLRKQKREALFMKSVQVAIKQGNMLDAPTVVMVERTTSMEQVVEFDIEANVIRVRRDYFNRSAHVICYEAVRAVATIAHMRNGRPNEPVHYDLAELETLASDIERRPFADYWKRLLSSPRRAGADVCPTCGR